VIISAQQRTLSKISSQGKSQGVLFTTLFLGPASTV